MKYGRIAEIINDQITWHKFNQSQQGAMSGVNYHIGAEDALRSLRDKLNDERGDQE